MSTFVNNFRSHFVQIMSRIERNSCLALTLCNFISDWVFIHFKPDSSTLFPRPPCPSENFFFLSHEYIWNPSCALCQVDHSRRTHDYDPFIRTFVTMLAEQGHVAQLVEQQTSLKRRLAQTRPPLKQLKRVYKRRKPRWILTLKWRREKRSSRWWKILCIPNGGG